MTNFAEEKSSITTEDLALPDLRPGQLVRSKAGRDKGHWYLVLATSKERVLLVDGKKRGPANPKAKNRCHLQPTHKIAADFVSRLENGQCLRKEHISFFLDSLVDTD